MLSNYRHLDFPVIISKTADSAASGIDARSDDGLSARLDKDAVSQLRGYLDGKVTVMLGHSGVGKSTMVNALTGAERATGGVNAVTGRGRHTSSSALALKVNDAPAGSWIIDTPGIRSFGLAHVDPDRILRSFPDLEPGTDDCERGCKHDATRRQLRRRRLGCGRARGTFRPRPARVPAPAARHGPADGSAGNQGTGHRLLGGPAARPAAPHRGLPPGRAL